MTPEPIPSDVPMMSEREFRMKQVADKRAAFAQLVEAMRQAGVPLLINGSGEFASVAAERVRLFAVLGLDNRNPKAKRTIERFLELERIQTRLEPNDGTAPLEFIALESVADRLAEFSQHPAMLAWKAVEQQRNRESAAWYAQKYAAERARKRRLLPATKTPLPFNVDAFAETLGFYDFGEGGRRQPNDQEPVDRWFMNEDGVSLYVRNGELLLETWRDDLSEEEEDLPTSDPRWTEVHIRQITFPIPQTAEEALILLIEADCWGNSPEEREDFLLDYRQALQPQRALKSVR